MLVAAFLGAALGHPRFFCLAHGQFASTYESSHGLDAQRITNLSQPILSLKVIPKPSITQVLVLMELGYEGGRRNSPKVFSTVNEMIIDQSSQRRLHGDTQLNVPR
jgi:hypothetical protein